MENKEFAKKVKRDEPLNGRITSQETSRQGSHMTDALEAKAEAAAAKARAKALRPWFKKKRYWLAAFVGITFIGSLFSGNDSSNSTSSSNTTRQKATASSAATTSPTVATSKETVSEANARRSAESYLAFQAFSREGLIKQLKFEGYSTADATYAVDAVDADWMAQAAKSAKAYLEFQSFSRSGLIDQLIFEGFTRAQAEYGVSTTGL